MMKADLKWPRILVLLASICLAGAIFLPIWQIQLQAPQYPEGLILKIFAKGLAGDVDVINGLNHYIGMQTLHNEDFIEFTLLPYIIGGLVLLGLITAFLNRKKVYYFYIALFMLVAVVSMVDFYRWEYNYGHNLDPNAAIVVPGMAYQPPLIGYKQLLNFGAYSIPDVGGWLFIAAGVLLAIAYVLILQPKWMLGKKKNLVVTACLVLILQSCSSGPQPITYGKDVCDFCRMSIVDKRFANEWVTNKGKVYRFDDVHCLLSYKQEHKSAGTAFINTYKNDKELTNAGQLFFIKADNIKGPMGGHIAAFASEQEAVIFANQHQGKQFTWNQVAGGGDGVK